MEIKIMIEKVFYNGNSFTEPIVSLKIGLLSILISLLFHMIIFFRTWLGIILYILNLRPVEEW